MTNFPFFQKHVVMFCKALFVSCSHRVIVPKSIFICLNVFLYILDVFRFLSFLTDLLLEKKRVFRKFLFMHPTNTNYINVQCTTVLFEYCNLKIFWLLYFCTLKMLEFWKLNFSAIGFKWVKEFFKTFGIQIRSYK